MASQKQCVTEFSDTPGRIKRIIYLQCIDTTGEIDRKMRLVFTKRKLFATIKRGKHINRTGVVSKRDHHNYLHRS